MSTDTLTPEVYFAPVLPWQQPLWQTLTARASSNTPLPHALLAAGMSGMGKRAFVWRLVAWLLCQQRQSHPNGACAQCDSCQWLRSGTHPSLQVLPASAAPKRPDQEDSAKKGGKKEAQSGLSAIKIDEVRALQPFINQGGQGLRLCVIDHAERMTIAAANALLKTLEEPQHKVHLLLISDAPANLLPTIKSRVQQLPLQSLDARVALDYVRHQLGGVMQRQAVSAAAIHQLLTISNGAPLDAIALADSDWYAKRGLWLTTWQALRSGKRSSTAASDYWQKNLSLPDFLTLCGHMLVDIERYLLGLAPRQQDMDFAASMGDHPPTHDMLVRMQAMVDHIKRARQQHVQDKLAYDKLMQALTAL